MSVANYNFLIIGGTAKAGTTSLYNYLSDHPQVSASYRKEVNFFLDKSYLTTAIASFEDGIEAYQSNFNLSSSDSIYVEASPAYLHSSGTPKRISSSLPKAKIIFILREPISKLISWYKFGNQIGIIKDLSLNEYITQQFDAYNNGKESILEQGLYTKYLRDYYDAMGKDRVKVILFDDLKSNPRKLMAEICAFCDIDTDYYDDYQFEVSNRSANMKSVRLHQRYITIRKWISLKSPSIFYSMRQVWKYLKPIYLRLNTRSEHDVSLSSQNSIKLNRFYADELLKLKNTISIAVPWSYHLDES